MALTEGIAVEPASFSDSYRCDLLADATLIYVVPGDEQEAMDAYWAARGGDSDGLGGGAECAVDIDISHRSCCGWNSLSDARQSRTALRPSYSLAGGFWLGRGQPDPDRSP